MLEPDDVVDDAADEVVEVEVVDVDDAEVVLLLDENEDVRVEVDWMDLEVLAIAPGTLLRKAGSGPAWLFDMASERSRRFCVDARYTSWCPITPSLA